MNDDDTPNNIIPIPNIPNTAPNVTSDPTPAIAEIHWDLLICDTAPNPDFPVDFGALWGACGYSRKEEAVRALKASGEEGREFSALLRETSSPKGGRPSVDYWLTLEAAEHFALQAGTPQGKAIRNYYIRIRKERHALLLQQAKQGGEVSKLTQALTLMLEQQAPSTKVPTQLQLPFAPAPEPSPSAPAAALKTLKEMAEAGAITEAEKEKHQAAIIGRITGMELQLVPREERAGKGRALLANAHQEMVERFIEAHCLKGPAFRVTSAELWAAYNAWTEEQGLPSSSIIVFGRLLATTPRISSVKSNGHRAWCGLALKLPPR